MGRWNFPNPSFNFIGNFLEVSIGLSPGHSDGLDRSHRIHVWDIYQHLNIWLAQIDGKYR